MQVRVTKRYYKRIKVGRDPIRYQARQPKGIGADVHVVITLDPVLKNHPDLRRDLLKHELDEIKAWGLGKSGGHTRARSKEPRQTREIGGVSGFWREIKRRAKNVKAK